MSETQRPIELFYSYAQADEKLRQKLEKHLNHLVQQHQIMPWHQQKILPGTNRVQEIDAHLSTAQIILLLVSSDFLASDYCYSQQMQRALERHHTQQATVIPILLRPVDWQGTLFAELEPLPSNHKPITSWSNQDEALLDIALGIRRAVDALKKPLAGSVQQEIKPVEQPPATPQPAITGLERPATVFLSYAREDTEDIKDLQLRLNVRGVRCWRDADDLSLGGGFEHEIVQAIEHEVDAIALFLTPDSLQSDFIWRVEIPAALGRHKRDPQFHIVPILRGISFAQLQQFCHAHHLADLSRFNGLSLAEDATGEEQDKKRNDAARRILQAAFTLRLRRINADRSYEPWISLKTFVSTPPTACLDLDLDWLKLVYEKERLPTPQQWDQTLLPALLDVKRSISEMIPSHRIHLLVKAILPVALALGFTFRGPARITLLLEGLQETWSTDAAPSEKEPLLREWIYNDQAEQQEAVIEVTTIFPIKQLVEKALSRIGITPGYHIRLALPELSREAVRDAAHAQAIARQVGRICQELCGSHGVTHIHLFAAIPVELAVLIGHQLNALCPITLYEYSNERVYTPIGSIQ